MLILWDSTDRDISRVLVDEYGEGRIFRMGDILSRSMYTSTDAIQHVGKLKRCLGSNHNLNTIAPQSVLEAYRRLNIQVSYTLVVPSSTPRNFRAVDTRFRPLLFLSFPFAPARAHGHVGTTESWEQQRQSVRSVRAENPRTRPCKSLSGGGQKAPTLCSPAPLLGP